MVKLNLSIRSSEGSDRFCFHQSLYDSLQVMKISVPANTCYPPHYHHDKDELYFVIRGTLLISQFNLEGEIINRAELGPGDFFLVRAKLIHEICNKSIHTAEFLEVRPGPFKGCDAVFLPQL